MANKLDKMCYTEFVEHLQSKGVKYREYEDVDVDYWYESYTAVHPLNSRIKKRYFSNDGGWQLF